MSTCEYMCMLHDINACEYVHMHVVGFGCWEGAPLPSDGQLVTSFGRKGEGPGEFNHPRGLAVDNNGVVYVCDLRNHHVQVF